MLGKGSVSGYASKNRGLLGKGLFHARAADRRDRLHRIAYRARAGDRRIPYPGAPRTRVEAVHGAETADRDRQPAPAEAFPELTEREREVLELIAQGLDNREIARRLSLSHKTIRNHVSNIFNKLQVAGRAEAIIRARDAGMGKLPPHKI